MSEAYHHFQTMFTLWRNATAEFLQLLEAVPMDWRREPGVCGDWSCQQIAAHLAGWQREAHKRYDDFQHGNVTSITYDIDGFNASSVEALKLLGWHEVLDTFRYTMQDLDKAAQRITAADTDKTNLYAEWLDGIGHDLIEHTEEIKAWLAARRRENT